MYYWIKSNNEVRMLTIGQLQRSSMVNYQFQPLLFKQMLKSYLSFTSATTQAQQHLDSYGKLQINSSIQAEHP